MNDINICGANEQKKEMLFQICRENGYKFGTYGGLEHFISENFLVSRSDKTIYSETDDYPVVHLQNLNISEFIKWINNEIPSISGVTTLIYPEAVINYENKTIEIKIPQRYWDFKIKHVA